jgi:hypothetical protein
VPLFAAPDSVFIEQAVPSPDGRSVAMVAEPCPQGTTGLVVRDLETGTQRSIGTSFPRCTDLGTPGWNSTGSELVIPYGTVPNPHRLPPPGVCPATRYAQLAIAPALHPSRASDWRLIAADPGCSFEAATFDASGIAAVEGCRRKGQSGSYVDPALGQARLLQLNRSDQVTARVNLKPGWEQGAITTVPSGQVLITQDQPANEPYPERDWVWEFDGRHLRLIRDYKADDAAQIIAIPYQQSPTTPSSSTRAVNRARSAGQGLTTVAVTRGEDLPHAYLKLHAAGLSVAFTRSFSLDWSYECVPVVARSIPRAGTHVGRGSVVSLRVRIPPCAAASPIVPVRIRPRRVPDFVGKRLTAAIHWTQRRYLFWAATIPPLRAGDAPSLFANYTITAQRPHPGRTILPVVKDHGGVRPTPLTLTVRP